MNEKVTMVLRILLALIFLVFGLNYFFGFFEMPPPGSEEAGAFMGALAATGYMFPLIKLTEVFAGLLLLINKWVGLALILASVLIVNIVLFHLKLDMSGIAVGAVMAVINIILIYANWKKFKTLF